MFKKSQTSLTPSQHCELSENDRSSLKMPKMINLASFWQSEACNQTVLPDKSDLIGQKWVENAKIENMRHFWGIFKHCERPFLTKSILLSKALITIVSPWKTLLSVRGQKWATEDLKPLVLGQKPKWRTRPPGPWPIAKTPWKNWGFLHCQEVPKESWDSEGKNCFEWSERG